MGMGMGISAVGYRTRLTGFAARAGIAQLSCVARVDMSGRAGGSVRGCQNLGAEAGLPSLITGHGPAESAGWDEMRPHCGERRIEMYMIDIYVSICFYL